MLISPQRLYTALPDGEVQIIDVRNHTQFQNGHVPGAIYLPVAALEKDEILPGGGRVSRQLRDPQQCARVLSAAGITDEQPIVLYDEGGSYAATRMWWILHCLGHDGCAVMNGGFSAWRGDISTVAYYTEPPARITYIPHPQLHWRAEFADVLTAQADSRSVLCDTMPRRHYERGSIPESMNLPYERLLIGRPVPTIRRSFEAEAVFAAAGIGVEDSVVFFSTNGYCSSLAFFCARLLGMEQVKLYDGSMEDWVARGGRLA